MPGVVLLPTVRVSVELAPAEIGLGLKPALVPAGTPVALRVTLWAEPLVTAVEMVDVVLPPWEALTLLGLALIEKSDGGAAVTVRLTDVEWVALLPVPVTVTV
jgi:hypothetical protein